MAVRLLGDRVMLKRLEAEKTSGGIVLPESAQERPQRAEVVAVGEGRRLDDGTLVKLEVEIGDVVVFAKYGGTEITVDGEEYVVVNSDQVYAKEA